MAETGARKLRAAQTGTELKAAAIRVFARVGYLNAKIIDITAEAGRATGSFYQHFASKEKLLEALLADLLAEGDASVAAEGHSDDFTDRAAVRYHVAAFWGFYQRHRVVMDALRQAAIVDPEFDRVVQSMMEPDRRHIADHLAKLDLPGQPRVIASMFGALVLAFAAEWTGTLPDDEAIETLTSFIYAGIGGKS